MNNDLKKIPKVKIFRKNSKFHVLNMKKQELSSSTADFFTKNSMHAQENADHIDMYIFVDCLHLCHVY